MPLRFLSGSHSMKLTFHATREDAGSTPTCSAHFVVAQDFLHLVGGRKLREILHLPVRLRLVRPSDLPLGRFLRPHLVPTIRYLGRRLGDDEPTEDKREEEEEGLFHF